MKSIGTLLLLLLPLITANQNPNAILSLTWMAGHCEYLGDRCNRQHYAQWDHQSLTINGLWPNQKQSRHFGSFNFDYLKSKGIIEHMHNYWPPQLKTGGLPHFLWQLSWQNHGQNYAGILMEIDSRSYNYLSFERRNEVLQESYFKRTVEFYKALNVRKLPKSTYSKASLAKQINIPEESFYPVCLSSGTLKEIRICTKITATSFNLRKCWKQESNCKESNLFFKDWKSDQLLTDQLMIPDLVYTSRSQKKVEDVIERIEIETGGFSDMSKMSNESKKELDDIQQIVIDSRIMETKRLEEQKTQFNDIMIQMELEQIIMELFNDILPEEDEAEKAKIHQISSITFTQQQMSERIILYIMQTAIVVSVFWIALFILCCCEKITNKKKNPKLEQTASDIRIDPNIKTKEDLQE